MSIDDSIKEIFNDLSELQDCYSVISQMSENSGSDVLLSNMNKQFSLLISKADDLGLLY